MHRAIIVVLLLTIFISCINEPAGLKAGSVTITAYSPGVKETFLNIKAELNSDEVLVIKRSGKEIKSFQGMIIDTNITDSGLEENTIYTYSCDIYNKKGIVSKSKELEIRTLKPSSHNFTWKKYYIGDCSVCHLKDVKILNDNDIWVVGEYAIRDSTGECSYPPYNAAHWNGKQWEFKSFEFETYPGLFGFASSDAVWGMSGNDYWLFSSAGGYLHWDGSNWEKKYITSGRRGSAVKVWGTSSENFYIACTNGGITHYDGKKFNLLETGTNSVIYDIWGYNDAVDGKEKKIAAVSNWGEIGDCGVMCIDETNKVQIDRWNSTIYDVRSVWTNNGYPFYIAGAGVFNNTLGKWHEINELPSVYSSIIRGNGNNDIMLGGHFGYLAHYNGIDWKVYDDFIEEQILFTALDIKGNKVVLSGVSGGRGVIVVGTRNE